MAKKLETPCAAPKRGIPWELKYDFAIRGWTSANRGYLYALREKYGSSTALEVYEMVYTMDDRVKKLTNAIRTIFNLEENDVETIGEVVDIWDELTGIESTILERSKTINRRKVTNCPWTTDPRDVSEWNIPFMGIVTKTINPKAKFERPKAMCAGDPYCEYVWTLEEIIPIEGEGETITKKSETPCAAPKRGLPWGLKYDFVMRSYTDFFKGILYAIREKYNATTSIEIYDRVMRMDDRVKKLTNAIRNIFSLEGNDAETIGEVLDIWDEICGYESYIIERSPTINRRKVTKCPWKVAYNDIGEYAFTMKDIMGKTVNPKAILERPKKMCTGDPYCEYIWRIEEKT